MADIRAAYVRLGHQLGIFEAVHPAFVVCIGNDRYSRQVVLRLPHLSRFRILGRAPSLLTNWGGFLSDIDNYHPQNEV